MRPIKTFGLVAGILAQSGGLLAQQPIPPVSPNIPAKSATAAIQGLVLDSLHGRYLPDAEIMVEGANKSALTDSAGRFTIEGLAPGTYRVGVFHPLLDTLGIALITKPFRAGPDSTSIAILAVPSAATIVHGTCPAIKRGDTNSAAIGRVSDPETLKPVAGAEVSLEWTEIEISKESGLRRTPHLLRDTTDAAGAFAICGLPNSMSATLQARKGSAVTAEIPIQIGDGTTELFARTLLLAAGASPKTGNASVSGRILLEGSGNGAGSRVELAGTESVAIANQNGEFTMTNLPLGSRLLVARHLGYGAASVAVDLIPGERQKVTMTLPKFTAIMDPVLVTARRNANLDRVGFSKRVRSGTGQYLGPDQIAKINAYRVHDILRRFTGIRIVQTLHGEVLQSSRGVSSLRNQDGCVDYFFDGLPWIATGPNDLNSFVNANEIAAVEVYQGPNTPAEFTRGAGNCLTIVLWSTFRMGELR